MADFPEPQRLILQLCSEDHVGLWFVIPHIEDFYRGDDRATIKSKTLQVIQGMLNDGLIQAGVPAENGRDFESWDLPPALAIARIDKEWRALGHEPSIGDIVWFTTTPAGDQILSQLVAQKKR